MTVLWLDQLVEINLAALAKGPQEQEMVLVCGDDPAAKGEWRKTLEFSGANADPALWLEGGVLRSACLSWELPMNGCCLTVPGPDGPQVAAAALYGELGRPCLYQSESHPSCENLSVLIARELLAARKMSSVMVSSVREGEELTGTEMWSRATNLAGRSLRRAWGPLQGRCEPGCPVCASN